MRPVAILIHVPDIEIGLIMCQLEDPFGNLIGLRGNEALKWKSNRLATKPT